MITQSERSQRESDAMLLGTAAHTESIFMFTLCLITFTTRTSAEQSYESTTYLTTTKPTSPILPLEYLLWLNRLDGTSTGEYPQKATMFPRAVRLDAWRSDGSTLSAADRGFQFRQPFLNGRRRIRPSKVMTGSRHERWNCIWKDSNGKPWKSMWWAPRFQRLFGGPPIINGETSRIMITIFLEILISMNRFHLCNWPEMQGNLMKKWMLLTRHISLPKWMTELLHRTFYLDWRHSARLTYWKSIYRTFQTPTRALKAVGTFTSLGLELSTRLSHQQLIHDNHPADRVLMPQVRGSMEYKNGIVEECPVRVVAIRTRRTSATCATSNPLISFYQTVTITIQKGRLAFDIRVRHKREHEDLTRY